MTETAKHISEALDRMTAELHMMSVEIADLRNRIFVDNGRKSIQTRLCNLESSFKVAITVVLIIATAAATNYARKLIVPGSSITVMDSHTVEKTDEK